MFWDDLTTREWATVLWAAALVVTVIAVPFLRHAFAPVVRTLMGFWQLHVTVLLFLGWVVLLCYLAHLAGAWNEHLVKDTIAWVIVYGFASLLSAHRAADEEHFFRRAALAALSVSALMQFVLNLDTFNIVVELFLLPIVTILFMLEAVAGMDTKTRPVQRLVNALLILIGLWVVIATARGLLDSWRGLDPKETGLAFAFSLWLPLAMLPFVYVFSLVLTYGANFSRARLVNHNKRPSLGVRAALLVGLKGDLLAVNDLPQHHAEYRAIVRSPSFREGLSSVRAYRDAREAERRETQEAAARLVRNAGAKGAGDDGRVLDQREIKETRDALRWIQTCHLGHYNNRGKYRADLMSDVLLDDFQRQGLTEHHGITMHVSRDGQAWYAWRRTPSGCVLGIGMNMGRDNEWLYQGEEPPQGFPGTDLTWGDRPYETPSNWW